MSARGQIIEKGKNRWLVRVPLGRDPQTGTRRYHNKTIHGTKREAQKYRTQVLTELDHGTHVEENRMTVWECLAMWLTTVAAPRVSSRTYSDYRANLERYIKPKLGERRLQELRPFEIQSVYAAMLERGLSPRTVRAAHAPMRSALENAVKWQLIARNPAKLVDLPKRDRTERRVLTSDEARNFLAAAREDRLHALWVVLISTGLRPGEALALKWTDLDEDRLRVQRNLRRTKNGGWELADPKTPGSRRTVTLPESALSALTAHRTAQARERLKLGPDYQDLDLIFCTAKGTPLDIPGITRRHFRPLLEAAGLPPIRLYDLRHTCATLLLAANVHPKVVTERLGHSSVTLTMDTYSHVLPTMQDGPAEQLERLLYG